MRGLGSRRHAARRPPRPSRPSAPPSSPSTGCSGRRATSGSSPATSRTEREVLVVDMRNHGESPCRLAHLPRDGRRPRRGDRGGGGAAWTSWGIRWAARRRWCWRWRGRSWCGGSWCSTSRRWPTGTRRCRRSRRCGGWTSPPSARGRRPRRRWRAEPGSRRSCCRASTCAGRRWRLNLDALAAHMGDDRRVSRRSRGASTGRRCSCRGRSRPTSCPSTGRRSWRCSRSARFARLKGAGHWLHADRPREVAGAVRVFLGPGA